MFALASICQEYQVQWIIDKIGNYITEELKFDDETYQTRLRFLKLVCMIKKEEKIEELIQTLDEPFQVLKMTEEFTWLNTSTKILIARKCLFELGNKKFKIMSDLPEQLAEFQLLTTENGCGLLSILKEYSQIEFTFENIDNDEDGFGLLEEDLFD